MNEIAPTHLESALLRVFNEVHGASGFPSPSDVSVVSRDNTGAGRYVGLKCSTGNRINDGYYDLGGKYIEIEGVPHGMMAVARVTGGYLVEMEITIYGGHSWDGVEREWIIK